MKEGGSSRRDTVAKLQALVPDSVRDWCRPTTRIAHGKAYREVLDIAVEDNADLIVMSSHRPAMRTYFLGSNAGHVVRYAKCSVLVVRN